MKRCSRRRVLKTNRVRADTTVVEANVAYPTTPAGSHGRNRDGKGQRTHIDSWSGPRVEDARPTVFSRFAK